MDGNATLFDVPARKLKEVQKALSTLDLDTAERLMDSLLRHYPDHREISREAQVVRFLEETLASNPKPAHLFGRFSAFKRFLKELSYVPDYFPDLERAYYGRVVDAFGKAPLEPIYGYPPGYLLLKAGRMEQARESLLEEASPASLAPKKRAHLLGYLGDLHVALGEIEEARGYYEEAILTDWAGIDTKALLDDDVRALVLGTYIPEGIGGIWAASIGHILMVFSPKKFHDPDEMMNFFKEFSRLRSVVDKDKSGETEGRIFYYALIMVENEGLFRPLKGTDMMELRKLMRGINPVLFRFYNKVTLSRKKGSDIFGEEK